MQDLTGLQPEPAEVLLERSGKSVKLALLMQWTGLEPEAGEKLLAEHKGDLRAAVASCNHQHTTSVSTT